MMKYFNSLYVHVCNYTTFNKYKENQRFKCIFEYLSVSEYKSFKGRFFVKKLASYINQVLHPP